MTPRPNHRGWIVAASISSDDGQYCVDLFSRADGSHGFEHFRAEPEDGGRWSPIGGHGSLAHASLADAGRAARHAVPWLRQHPQARRSISALLGELADTPDSQSTRG